MLITSQRNKCDEVRVWLSHTELPAKDLLSGLQPHSWTLAVDKTSVTNLPGHKLTGQRVSIIYMYVCL